MADIQSILTHVSHTAELTAKISSLALSDVLLGVPAAKAARSPAPGEKGPVPSNAQLMYWHEFGVPSRNIPARPVVYPAVRSVRAQLTEMLLQGARDVLKGGSADPALNRVGMLGRNAMIRQITDPSPPFAPLKPATVRARLRRTQAGRRKLRTLKKKGIPVTGWAEAGNIRPLLDTLQLRAALTFVVRKG